MEVRHPISTFNGPRDDSVVADEAAFLHYKYYKDHRRIVRVSDPRGRLNLAQQASVAKAFALGTVFWAIAAARGLVAGSWTGFFVSLPLLAATRGAKAIVSPHLGSVRTVTFSVAEQSDYEGDEDNWFEQFQLMIGRLGELDVYLECLTPEDVAWDHVKMAKRSIHELIWDCMDKYRKIAPYLKQKRRSTRPVVNEALKSLRRQQLQTATIIDGLFALGARSSAIGLGIGTEGAIGDIINQLSELCLSLDDLAASQRVAHALPSGEEAPLAWEADIDDGTTSSSRLGSTGDKAVIDTRTREEKIADIRALGFDHERHYVIED